MQVALISHTSKTVSHASIAVSHTSITVSHTSIAVSRTGIAVSRTGIAVSRTGIAVSRTSIAVSRTSIAVSRTSIAVSHTSTAVSFDHGVNGPVMNKWWSRIFIVTVTYFYHDSHVFLSWQSRIFIVTVTYFYRDSHIFLSWRSRIFIVTVTIGHSHESSNFKKLNLDTLYNGHWGFSWSQNLLALSYKPGYFWLCIWVGLQKSPQLSDTQISQVLNNLEKNFFHGFIKYHLALHFI